MQLTLTITGYPSELQKILAAIDTDPLAVIDKPTTAVAAPVAITEGPLVEAAAPVQQPVMPEVVATAPTISGEPEFDSSGLAWDERIHSKQKGQTNDGKWRKQRGVDENYYKQVEAELRARYGSPVAAPAPVAAPMGEIVGILQSVIPMGNVPPMPIMSGPHADMEHGADDADNAVSEPVAVIPMPTLAPVAAPVAAPAEEPVTFHTIMTHIGGAMSSGAITPDYLVQLVSEINQQCGTAMQSFTDMAAFPQAVEYCWAALARDGKR